MTLEELTLNAMVPTFNEVKLWQLGKIQSTPFLRITGFINPVATLCKVIFVELFNPKFEPESTITELSILDKVIDILTGRQLTAFGKDESYDGANDGRHGHQNYSANRAH